MKKFVIIMVLLTVMCISVTTISCESTKQVIVDNKELIKQVLVEIIDRIIDMIDNTPGASVSKSVIKLSSDNTFITVDIVDHNGDIIKSVKYDILKRYQELDGF